MKRSAAEVQKSLRKKLIQAAHEAHTASDFAKRDAMLARARKIAYNVDEGVTVLDTLGQEGGIPIQLVFVSPDANYNIGGQAGPGYAIRASRMLRMLVPTEQMSPSKEREARRKAKGLMSKMARVLAKEAGCEKLPPALRSNCEKKSKGGDEKSEDKGKEAAVKVAVNKETEEFARWVFSTQGPMSPGEVEAFVKRQLGIKTSPPKKKRTGPRYQRGDQVEIKFAKHKDAKSDPGPYKRFDGKIGTVTEVNESDKSCMVAFKGEPAPVRFEGALKTRGVGIYKYTAPYTIQGSAKIEMIYVAGGKPTEDAKLVVDAYVSRGGEKQQRSGNYYTGHVVMASVGGNGYYFRAFPQQRVEMGTEGGFRPRTFNPSKGQVLYVGLFGKRPSNWKRELEKLDKMAMEESAA